MTTGAARAASRAAIAVLLVALAAVGARAAWPKLHWSGEGNRFLVTGLVLEAALAILFAALYWRHPRQPATEPARSLRRILTFILVALLAADPVLLIVAHLHPGLGSRTSPVRYHFPHHTRPGLPPKVIHVSYFHVGPVLLYSFIAAVVIAIAVLAVLAYLNRRRQPKLDELPVVIELAEEDLARAVESGRLALREFDDARLAIIRCYVAMEHSLAEAGAVRDAAETPDELLARAVAEGLVPDPPARALTILFYEARFSTHPMPPSQRDEAEHALAELAAALPSLDRLGN